MFRRRSWSTTIAVNTPPISVETMVAGFISVFMPPRALLIFNLRYHRGGGLGRDQQERRYRTYRYIIRLIAPLYPGNFAVSDGFQGAIVGCAIVKIEL